MKIKFIKPLRIALGGIDVKKYEPGQVIEDPHQDVLADPSYFEIVDEEALAAQKLHDDKQSLRDEIVKTETRVVQLHDEFEARFGEKPFAEADTLDDKDGDGDQDDDNLGDPEDKNNDNFWEDVTLDEGTKDERTERQRIVKKHEKKKSKKKGK